MSWLVCDHMCKSLSINEEIFSFSKLSKYTLWYLCIGICIFGIFFLFPVLMFFLFFLVSTFLYFSYTIQDIKALKIGGAFQNGKLSYKLLQHVFKTGHTISFKNSLI